MKIEANLIVLAYLYLQRKCRKTKKEFDDKDILETCELILRKMELKNRKLTKITYKDGVFEIIEEKVGDIRM